MASTYPTILDSLATNKVDGTPTVGDHAQHHDDLADAVNKIEAVLGVSPAGVFPSVASYLAGLNRAALSASQVLEVGIANNRRAGRQLALTDFTTLLGLSAPVGLWNLSDLTDVSGNARTLTNKGTVTFGAGITGAATEAAIFTGSTAQALYIADAAALRIATGSWGCWFRTAKRGTQQALIEKWGVAAQSAFTLEIQSSNTLGGNISTTGSDAPGVLGVTDVCDDRWHHAVMTFDGTAIRLYVDGQLEATTLQTGTIFAGTSPLDIGIRSSDATNTAAGTLPNFGRIDEAGLTADVLNEDQIRLLYAKGIPHGLSVQPSLVTLNVRRKRKGATLASGDFPAQPSRLYSFTAGALTDAGSNATAVTVSAGTVPSVAGADGSAANGQHFNTSGSLQATDAGLPSGTASRSYGGWFKTSAVANGGIIAWGTITTADARLAVNASGLLGCLSGADAIFGPYVADGQWHFVVAVEDNAPTDGVKRKLYLDGRLVAVSTTLTSLTLAGANKFHVGSASDGTLILTGDVDEAFVYAGALTPEQALSLYVKGSLAHPAAPKDIGPHVEGVDATNVYFIGDTLESQHTLDLRVAA